MASTAFVSVGVGSGVRSSRLWRGAALCGIAVFPAIVGLFLFGSAGGDDSHITWWVVDELVRTGRIVNLNGSAIEQSSSLALVLIMAALRSVLPWSTPSLGVVFSLLAASAACWMCARAARRIDPKLSLPAALLLATSAPLVCWGTSGMETALAVFASAWLLDALGAGLELPSSASDRAARKLPIQGLSACALFVTVRPENPLILSGSVSAAAGLLWILERQNQRSTASASLRRLFNFSLGALALVVALCLARRVAFHAWFPQPVTAKSGGALRWSEGWSYFLQHTCDTQPALLLLLPLAIGALFGAAVVAGRAAQRFKPICVVIALQATLGILFVIACGGDWMSCGRFLAPQLPVWWLAMLAAASEVWRLRFRWLGSVALLLSAINGVYVLKAARTGANGYPLTAALQVVPAARRQYSLERYAFLELANKSHLRDAVLSEELKRVVAQVASVLPRKIWLASSQAGAVPYAVFSAYPERLRFIDYWGLTNAEPIACLPAERLQHSNLGVSVRAELLFEFQERVERDCGVPPADIVFNTSLSAATRRALETRGYSLVYLQKGSMPSFSLATHGTEPSFLGGQARMDAYIAVRSELAAQLRLTYREARWTITG